MNKNYNKIIYKKKEVILVAIIYKHKKNVKTNNIVNANKNILLRVIIIIAFKQLQTIIKI